MVDIILNYKIDIFEHMRLYSNIIEYVKDVVYIRNKLVDNKYLKLYLYKYYE